METSTRKHPILRNIISIQVVTILVHPKVYPIVQLVNLLELSSGEAGVSQTTKEENKEDKDPDDQPDDPDWGTPEEKEEEEEHVTRKRKEDSMRKDPENSEPSSKIKKHSEGGISTSRGPKYNPFCATVDSQDPEQRAAIKKEYDELLNQNHGSLGEIAAAAPNCSSDNFVSQHSTPQTGHLISCQKCGTESENGSTICGNCFHFIVYEFDGGKVQSLKVAFFNEQGGAKQAELRV
jgi:hypothetical protein